MINPIYLLIFFSYALILTSCLPEAIYKDVLIYNSELLIDDSSFILTIDGDTIEIDTQALFTKVLLEKGDHYISSNGIFPDTINIKGDCVLTSGKNKFFNYPVDFISETRRYTGENLSLHITGPILFEDSLVVYKSTEFESIKGLTNRLKEMIEKSQNGDYTTLNKSIAKKSLFLLLKPHGGVIKKRWDYTIENIPDEINLRNNLDVETKTMLLPDDFLKSYVLFDESLKMEAVEDQESLDIIKAYIAMKHELLGY